MSRPEEANPSTSESIILDVSSVLSSKTRIWSRFLGHSREHAALMHLWATYLSLYMGSWTVTTGWFSSLMGFSERYL